jgi:hypothetical protein
MSNTSGAYDNARSGGGGGRHQDNSSSPPPYKRNRRDWDSSTTSSGGNVPDYSVYGSGNASRPYAGQSQHSGGGNYSSNVSSNSPAWLDRVEPEYPTQPPMLSFKQFLAQQDDNISDEDAIKRYNDYKLDFKRTQINKFFLDHRDEEW